MISTLQDSKGIREQKRSLLSQIEIALSSASTHFVTFSSPGGGEYRIPGSNESLKRFKALVQQRFGKKFSYRNLWGDSRARKMEVVYSPTDLNADYSESIRGASMIPPVNKAPTSEDITEAVSLFKHPDDYTCPMVSQVVKDGPFTIATDEHIMMVATGGEGEPIKETSFPQNWQRVIPKIAKLTDKISVTTTDRIRVDIDTAEMLHDLNSLRGIFEVDKGDAPVVAFYQNKTLKVTNPRMHGSLGGEGQTGPVVGNPLFNFHAGQMLDILGAIRRIGLTVVSFYFAPDNDPLVIVEQGKTSRFVIVIMPWRAS